MVQTDIDFKEKQWGDSFNKNKGVRTMKMGIDLKRSGKCEAGSGVCLFNMSPIIVQNPSTARPLTNNLKVISMPMYHVHLLKYLRQQKCYTVQATKKII